MKVIVLLFISYTITLAIYVIKHPVLKDIKGRIYSENWSMNYREGEGLLKCINAATKLSDKNSVESNDDCKKFLYEVVS